MLRGLVALLGVALIVGAWLLLRETHGTAPVGVRSLSAQTGEAQQVEQVREAAPDVRESVSEPAPRGPTRATRAEHTKDPRTGVLAGRVLLDGLPLTESIELRIAPDDGWDPLDGGKRGAFRTDHQGLFRRERMPADWSGMLILPRPYVVPMDVTMGSGYASAVEIDGLRQDLVIEVMRLPAVRLRVLHADGTSAPGAEVSMRQQAGRSGTVKSRRADEAGLVTFERMVEVPARIEVSATSVDGGQASATFEGGAVEPDERSGDVDLGDLVLGKGRSVALHLVDERGQSLPGLTLPFRRGQRREVLHTDDDGIVTIGLEVQATTIDLEAEGFWPVQVDLPAGVEELEVTLRRANRLRVEVVDAEGLPLEAGRVRLSAARPPFGEGRWMPPGFYSRHGGPGISGGGNERDGYRCDMTIGPDGAVEFWGLEPGLDLDVRLRDPLGIVGAELQVPGLGEGEERTVRLTREGAPCTLEVRVLDLAGRPVPRAEVLLIGAVTSVQMPTDAEGLARFEHLLAPRVEVRARSDDREEVVLQDVAPCVGSVTLRLAAARTLEVRVRDAEGRNVTAGRLTLSDADGTSTFEERTLSGGFASLPFEPLVLTWSLCGQERRVDVDPDQATVELVVPSVGQLVVSVEGREREEGEHLRLRAEPLDGSETACDGGMVQGAADPVWLWAGRYRLTLESTNVRRGVLPVTRQLGEPIEVVVEAGASRAVVFRP